AYANAETISAFRRRVPGTDGAPETRRREIIVLRHTGRHLISPRAADWLTQYFNDDSSRRDRLPDDLQRWVRRQALTQCDSDMVPPPATPLMVQRENTQLSARLIPDSPDDLLVLEEDRRLPDYAVLQRLGLTP